MIFRGDLLTEWRKLGGTMGRFGWRAKIGLIVPSVQTVTEPLYARLVPEGVSVHGARALLESSTPEALQAMDLNIEQAAIELASAKVSVLVNCCTMSGILHGLEKDREFCEQIAYRTGIPTTSTVQAIAEVLPLQGLRRLIVVSPYDEVLDKAEHHFLTSEGYEVLGAYGLGLTDGCAFADVPREDIYRFCREHWDSSADGLFISCMNFDGFGVVDILEQDLSKPVITSHSATLWKALTMAGVQEPLTEGGKLLKDSGSMCIEGRIVGL